MDLSKYIGLTEAQVIESRNIHGANVLTVPPRPSLWSQLIEKFADPLIRILLVALLLSVALATYEVISLNKSLVVYLEPVGILFAILLATLVGFAVEVNANKKFEILNQISDEVHVKVLRNNKVHRVLRNDIVVGDIVILETGEEVPADGELLESLSLIVNESSLTGEPQTRKSHLEADFKSDATYPTNYLLRGSTIIDGSALMKVKCVGDHTEYGKVFTAAQIDNGVTTPLMLQLDHLGKQIARASYVVAALIFIGRLIVFFLDGGFTFDWVEFLDYMIVTVMLAVTLIVVSVPEGLPMSVTLSLALSMRRMLVSNNLVRKMHACETMGAATVICTDKTGTLTQNKMTVNSLNFIDDSLGLTSEAISFNTTAFLDDSENASQVIGNPTEGALLMWLREHGIDYANIRNRGNETQLPFSTERKYMATISKSKHLNENRVLWVKGAPEIVLNMCSKIDAPKRLEVEEMLLSYQKKGMRTLGFAYKVLKNDEQPIKDNAVICDDLNFQGVVAISDPVRSDVPDAIKQCIEAGIEVKIITGDTPATAGEIGRQVGVVTNNLGDSTISGPEFAALNDKEASEYAKKLKVMSRARPSDKQRLVELLQKLGHVVAVTGDGTNDAPALNAAQVGLSMGDGTQVAKEASDITILDNSFASIAKAVMWGRSLYLNIQRFLVFQLTVNVAACIVVGLGAFVGKQSPLTVTQMLWVNLIMDTFAALALASLPPSNEVMHHKPRKAGSAILTSSMLRFILSWGAVFSVLLITMIGYFKGLDQNGQFSLTSVFNLHGKIDAHELTIIFTTFVMFQFWNMFNAKAFANNESSALASLCESKVFVFTTAVILLGQIAIVQFCGQMFSVVPLSVIEWLVIIGATSVVLWIGELIRIYNK